MTEIHAIDKQSVHQICSGQVILNLASAVKELVENSLDSGATSVEIKLKEYGLNLVEVVDNGTGVEEQNFQGLTLKHHTSKLRVFSDLTSVETFGFRGEALSSLCAVCKLTITTKHKSARVGHKLEFNNNGEITKKTCVARQPGTSVTLSDLFITLPVRFKEFRKNVKKEYTKLLVLLNGYCLISTGVRISCTNETGKGNRSTVLSTTGVSSVRDNISTIFGIKHCSTLLPFKQILPSEEVCETYSLKFEDSRIANELYTIAGFVSSCGPGLGRTSKDRQFLSINKRPCDIPKLTKVINEVYHTFNRYQYPFVQLELSTSRQDVDVNVTPDKRKIFMQNEKLLLATVKSSLLAMYNEGGHAIGGLVKQPQSPAPMKNENIKVQGSLNGFVTQSSPCFQGKTDKRTTSNIVAETKSNENMERTAFLSQFQNVASPVSLCSPPTIGQKRLSQYDANSSSFKQLKLDPMVFTKHEDIIADEKNARERDSDTKFGVKIISKEECKDDDKYREERNEASANAKSKIVTDTPCQEDERPFQNVEISLAALKKAACNHDSQLKTEGDDHLSRNFRAKISSNENQQAEAELTKYFTKESFLNMKIIGQFNLGFIIAQHDDDLFIIDQHASDEKYNFEMLQKTTELHGQKLIIPQKLELTAGDRLVMQENSHIFEQNGFAFSVALDKDTNQETIFLTRVPTSKNRTFDHTDVAELIFMLTDAPGVLCRPSRISQMFASRSCRKSIMIGTALSKHEMHRIVNHMADLDQPWNCPHGRPTMRHVINLSMVLK